MGEPNLQDLLDRISKLEDLLRPRIPGGGVTDPGPDGWVGGWIGGPRFTFPSPWGPGGPRTDPSPIDFSRFNKSQLEVTREMIRSDKVRLEAFEKLVDQQIKSIK
jgi:hypothetical protein